MALFVRLHIIAEGFVLYFQFLVKLYYWYHVSKTNNNTPVHIGWSFIDYGRQCLYFK